MHFFFHDYHSLLPQVGPTKAVWEQSQTKRPQPSRQVPPCMQGLEEQEPPSLWQKLTIEPEGGTISCEWPQCFKSLDPLSVNRWVKITCFTLLLHIHVDFFFKRWPSHLSLVSWHRKQGQMLVHWWPNPSCNLHSPDQGGQTTPPEAPPHHCSLHQHTMHHPDPSDETLLQKYVG